MNGHQKKTNLREEAWILHCNPPGLLIEVTMVLSYQAVNSSNPHMPPKQLPTDFNFTDCTINGNIHIHVHNTCVDLHKVAN